MDEAMRQTHLTSVAQFIEKYKTNVNTRFSDKQGMPIDWGVTC